MTRDRCRVVVLCHFPSETEARSEWVSVDFIRRALALGMFFLIKGISVWNQSLLFNVFCLICSSRDMSGMHKTDNGCQLAIGSDPLNRLCRLSGLYCGRKTLQVWMRSSSGKQ